jgi:hypothetical protein
MQYYNYGFWRVAVLNKHKIPISYRQQTPILFYLTVIILFVLGLALNNLILSILLLAVYAMVIIAFSMPVFIHEKFSTAIRFPWAIIILHLSYAAGFFMGVIKFLVLNERKY